MTKVDCGTSTNGGPVGHSYTQCQVPFAHLALCARCGDVILIAGNTIELTDTQGDEVKIHGQVPIATREVRQPHVFWLRDEKNNPVACVASEVGWLTKNLRFAVATHNPADQFSWSAGRELALERLRGSTDWLTGSHRPKQRLLMRLVKGRYSNRVRSAALYRLRESLRREGERD